MKIWPFSVTFSFPSAKMKGQKGGLFSQQKESPLCKIREMNHLSHSFCSSKSTLKHEPLLWGSIWAPCPVAVFNPTCSSFKENFLIVLLRLDKENTNQNIDSTLLFFKKSMTLRDKNMLIFWAILIFSRKRRYVECLWFSRLSKGWCLASDI